MLIGSQLRSWPKARLYTSLGPSPQVPCPKNNQGLKARSNASVARLRNVSSCISPHRTSPLCGTNLPAVEPGGGQELRIIRRFGHWRFGGSRMHPPPHKSQLCACVPKITSDIVTAGIDPAVMKPRAGSGSSDRLTALGYQSADVAELADALDSKSSGP